MKIYASRNYPLYHATSVSSLVTIINSNTLLAKSSYAISSDKIIYGVSLTRDLDFAKQWIKNDVIFVFDANKLCQNYQLIPRGATNFACRVKNSKNGKAEEFLKIGESPSAQISNISKYICQVLVRPDIDTKYNLIAQLKDEGIDAVTY